MQEALIDWVVNAMESDEELGHYQLKSFNHDRVSNIELETIRHEFTAEVYSLGFSQTNGQGGLEPYYYFGIVLRWRKPLVSTAQNYVTIDRVTDRIVKLLHRNQYEPSIFVLFSKALRVYEKHTIELNTRRLTLDPKEGQEVSGIFFYVRGPYEKYYEGEPGEEPGEGVATGIPEESSGQSTPQVIYVRGDAIWD